MNFPAHSRFDFHKNGHANRRDRDAQPRVLLLDVVTDPYTGDFAHALAHWAGDEYVREIGRHSINDELIAAMQPAQAFDLGRVVEGGELCVVAP